MVNERCSPPASLLRQKQRNKCRGNNYVTKNIEGEGQTRLPFEPFMRNTLLLKPALVLVHQAIEQLVVKQQAICHKVGSN